MTNEGTINASEFEAAEYARHEIRVAQAWAFAAGVSIGVLLSMIMIATIGKVIM